MVRWIEIGVCRKKTTKMPALYQVLQTRQIHAKNKASAGKQLGSFTKPDSRCDLIKKINRAGDFYPSTCKIYDLCNQMKLCYCNVILKGVVVQRLEKASL